jgi:hypothetical protein
MKRHTSPVVRALLRLAVAVVALTVIGSLLPGATLQAQRPGYRRSIRFVGAQRFRGMHRTIRFTLSPGSDYDLRYGPCPCSDVAAADGSAVWVVYPSDRNIYLEDPYRVPAVAVWVCGQEPENTQYTLAMPDGSSVLIPPAPFTDPCPASAGQAPASLRAYEFPPDSQADDYIVTIQSPSHKISQLFNLSEYIGRRVRLDESLALAGGGQALEVEYLDFDAAQPVQACLYRDVDPTKGDLKRTWRFTTDAEGSYREVLSLDGLEDGSYVLLALAESYISCPPSLDRTVKFSFVWQGVAYNEFELKSEEEAAPPAAEGDYFNLQWVPGCDPARPLALLSAGQGGCGGQTERRDLAWLVDELRQQGLLADDEWLVQVALGPATGSSDLQGLAIQSQASAQSGWIRVGGGLPGSVWRTTYYPPGSQVGSRCWLRTDYTWSCQ